MKTEAFPRPVAQKSAPSSEVNLLAKSGSLSLVGQVVNAVAGSAFLVVTSHTLVQTEAGGLFEAISIFTTASVIATCGADVGLMRFIPMVRRRGMQATRRIVVGALVPTAVAGVLLGLVIFVTAPALASLLVEQGHLRSTTISQLHLLAPLIPCAGLTVAGLAATRAWTVTPSVLVQYVLVPVLRLVLYAILLIFGITLFSATVAWASPVALGFVATLVLARRYLRRPAAPTDLGEVAVPHSPDDLSVGAFWRFSSPRLLENALLVFFWGADVVLVGILTSPRLAAAYAVASRYITVATLVSPAIQVAIPTRISELMSSGREEEAAHIYRVATWWMMIVAWPCAFAMIVYAPFLMDLFGRGYRVGDSCLALLSLGVLANSGTGPVSSVLLMSGSARMNLAVTAVSVLVNFPLLVVLTPPFGLVGAGIASAAGLGVMNVVGAFLLIRRFRISPFRPAYAYVAAASAVSFVGLGEITARTLGQGMVSFATYAVISIAVYSGFLYAGRSELELGSFTAMIRPGS